MDKEIEIWVDSFEFPNYEFSNLGRVKHKKTQRIRNKSKNDRQYETITVTKDKKNYTKKVARLVWEAFNQCKCNKTIDHINRVKTDNRLGNLRCVGMRTQMLNRNKETKNYNLTDKIKSDIMDKIINKGYTTYKIWREYDIPTNYLSSVLKRGTWNKYLTQRNNE